MQTDSHALSPLVHRIAAGQALGLDLLMGSEVFCRQGRLRLTLGPLARLEAHCGYALALAAGQGWRAPGRVWVQCASAGQCVCIVAITPGVEEKREWRWWPPLKVVNALKERRARDARKEMNL
jgi:hypothetical protein